MKAAMNLGGVNRLFDQSGMLRNIRRMAAESQHFVLRYQIDQPLMMIVYRVPR